MNNLAIALLHQKRHLDEALTLAERAAAAGGGRVTIYRETLAEVKAQNAPPPPVGQVRGP
jgi:hypothetical protein